MRSRITTTVLAIGTAAAISVLWLNSAFAAPAHQLPVQLSDDNHLMVMTMVNGEGPFPFIVDTAAASTVVFDNLVDAVNLQRNPDMPLARIQGASGVTDAPIVNVGEVAVGDWQFDLPYAVALPELTSLDEEVFGILGINVLMQQPIGFQLSSGLINIYEPNSAIDPDTDLTGRWFQTSYDHRPNTGQFMWIEVAVNGVAIQGIMDTGARRTVINTAAVEALGFEGTVDNLVEAEPIRGGTNNATPAWNYLVSTVQFGERVWGSRNLTLADPSVIAALGMGDQPMIIFGSDFMAEQDFIIDPITRVIWMQGRRSAAFGGTGAAATVENSAAAN